MASKQSATDRLLSAVSRLEENIARLEGVLNRVLIRLESLESGGRSAKHRTWTWSDAGIPEDVVGQLEELSQILTGNSKLAVTLMIQTHGRLPFEDFALSFDGWTSTEASGKIIVSDGAWGGCRKRLNATFEAYQIPIEIAKEKGGSDVVLRFLGT